MAFDVTDYITISDISDGSSPVAYFLSNEQHSFAATSVGVVSATEREGFSSTPQIFVGGTQYTSGTSSSPSGTNFYIVSASATNSFTTAINRTTGAITVATIPTGTGVGNETSTITVVVKVAGITNNISRSISLSKSIAGQTGATGAQGSAGPVLRLTASRNAFSFANGATSSTDASIVLEAASSGTFTATAVTWKRSINGAANVDINTTTPPTGYTFATVNQTNDKLTVTSAGFGNLNTLSLEAKRDSSTDILTMYKIEAAKAGADSVDVRVSITSGSAVFKNNTGTTIFRADVYIGGVLQSTSSHNGYTYQWKKNGTNVVGATSRSLTVQASDVTDNGSELYSVQVIST